jgi:hypothetical protein
MFHIFYSVNYWLANRVFNNRDIPVFSAVIYLSLIQSFTLFNIYDFIFFHLYHRRDIIIDVGNVRGYTIITIILIMNLLYFSKRSNKILKEFDKLEKRKKTIYKIISVFYILSVIVFTIIIGFSIKNNRYWF